MKESIPREGKFDMTQDKMRIPGLINMICGVGPRKDTAIHGTEGWGIIEESEAGNDLTEEESLTLEDMNEIMNENIY